MVNYFVVNVESSYICELGNDNYWKDIVMEWLVLKKDDKYYINKIVLILSMLVLVSSFTQTAYCVDGNCGVTIGIFFFGFIGLLLCFVAFSWLANPILILSWFYYKKTKVSFILSTLSSVFAISFLFFDEYNFYSDIRSKYIESVGLGYWLWLTSNLIMLIGNGIILYKNKDIRDKLDKEKAFKYHLKGYQKK